ncbi:MAG: helix-turn-helix domain-containing protein [Bacteroidales bacterium]|nr:helix-turn-helix domain-containing protein [Bacteroidales bacterium]
MNAELELAWNFIEKTNQNLFLTGKAGTGKTTFLHKVRNESFKRMVVVAPTGVAAINAKGVTIHSFFQLPFGPILPEMEERRYSERQKSRSHYKFNRRKIDIIRSLDLLIIDEISMVRADLLDGIDQVLRQFKDKNKVFGGIQVLMIGDLQQLAPVVKPDEWRLLSAFYETPFFFSSKSFQRSNALGIELKYIFRQKNESFIKILNEIRNNSLSEQSLQTLNEHFDEHFTPDPDEGYITLTTHNNRADQINNYALSEIKNKPHFFTAEIEGDFSEYAYPTHYKLELKVGAQVMFIKNDSSPEKKYYNGKIGKIIEIGDEFVVVRCSNDSSEIYVGAETWENVNYTLDEKTKEISEEVKGIFSQLPLRLAWAITIHKSQGLTFEKAIIDAEASFAHGQTYVALSRCRTLEGIVLKSRINKNGIIQDEKVLSFSHEVEQNPPDDKQLNKSKKEYQLELIQELFDYKPFLISVNKCIKVADQNKDSLQGNIFEPLLTIKEKGVGELVQVGENFQKQLIRLSQEEKDPENNTEVKERILKAISYFIEQTENNMVKPLSEIGYTTDNREVKKGFKEALLKTEELISVKLFCLNALKDDGFSTLKYLEARAKSVLQEQKPVRSLSKEKVIGPRPELFSRLSKLRHELAESGGVAHYQIFSQKTLFDLCEKIPVTKEQFSGVHGMGKIRIMKYGNKITALIQAYCKEKGEVSSEVKKPEKKPKENTKNISLRMFGEGMGIPEIAKERGFTEGTIEGHLAHFILDGTLKLEELMNHKRSDLLKEKIRNTEFGSIGELRMKLNEEFSYGEIKMVLNSIQYESSKTD